MNAILPPNYAILAGGTGGHIYPALAVAEELAGRGYAIHWFGTRRGLEEKLVPAAGHTLHLLELEGLRGRGRRPGRLLRALALAAGAVRRAVAAMRELRPAGALGMGGYAAGPAGIAAWLAGVPLVIHEQNAVAGTANRILRRFARRALCAYPNAFAGNVFADGAPDGKAGTQAGTKAGKESADWVGNPVRAELARRGARAGYDYRGGRPLRVLVLGGSQGAQALNAAVPLALRLLPPGLVAVRHQTGPAHIKAARDAYRGRPSSGGESVRIKAELFPYIEDMAAAYEWADLALCRAGALTLAELTVMGRPAILVPLPNAIDDHQARNADWLARAGAAVVLPQSELAPESLAKQLRDFAARPARLGEMARAAFAAAAPDAAAAVADICEEVRYGQG